MVEAGRAYSFNPWCSIYVVPRLDCRVDNGMKIKWTGWVGLGLILFMVATYANETLFRPFQELKERVNTLEQNIPQQQTAGAEQGTPICPSTP